MKKRKNMLDTPFKDIKKIIYHGRVTKFKQLVAFMLVGGIIASVLYFCKSAYENYAVSEAHIVVSYPEIALSQYPDGSRFTYYDFVNNDRINEALEIMHKKGKYKYFTADDLRNKFQVYSYLDKSATSNVSAVRSEGNDFSYVANEYAIYFTQPHDYKNPNIFKKFFVKDNSKEFLKALVEVNKSYISDKKGGISGFKTVSHLENLDSYDYDEKIIVYKAKKNNILLYLNYISKRAPKFRSKQNNMTINDVKSKYNLLITNKVDSISNYIDSSGISKNPEAAANKIKVNIENAAFDYNKLMSEAEIYNYATTHYDQTFTENLINVVQDESQGLYQARPKTAFDTVVNQMNTAKENASEYNEKIAHYLEDLDKYYNSAQDEETTRIMGKCESLFNDLKNEYLTFTDEASKVVNECLNEINESFITYKLSSTSLFSASFIIKTGIYFILGALIMFLLNVLLTVISDRKELRRKQKILRQIRATAKGE